MLSVAAVTALVAYGLYANDRAERNASAFCREAASVGAIADVVARAERESIRHYLAHQPEAYHFLFPGWVFNVGVCQAEIEGPAIRKTRVWLAGD